MTRRVWCFRCDHYALADAESYRCVNCNCLSWELLAIAARDGTAEDKYSPPKRGRFKRGKKVRVVSAPAETKERNICAC